MNINFVYDASVNAAPTQFKTALNNAAQYLDNLITNPITVTLQIGWGENDGAALGTTIANGGPKAGIGLSYSSLVADLKSHATSAADSAAMANLPTVDPTNGGHFYVGGAQQKALGLLAANSVEVDGTLGFGTTQNWDFDPTNGISTGQLDFNGVALHEITHALGRSAGLQYQPGWYEPLDLFRFSSVGNLQLVDHQASYFSIDGGRTNLNNFDTVYDSADWADTVRYDSFGYGYSSVVLPISSTDLKVMDILGYNLAPSVPQILADYNAITRTTLSTDLAATIVNSITAGTQTEAQYVSGLIGTVSNSTGAALLLHDFIDGVTPTSVSLDSLTGTANNLIAQAGGNANGSWQQMGASLADSGFNTAFVTKYANLSIPDLVSALYQEVYGSAAPSNAQTYFQNLVAYYQNYFAQFADSHDPTGLTRARGTLIGDMLKEAMDINWGKYPAAEKTFLTAAANGTAIYGQDLLASHDNPAVPVVGTAITADHTASLV